MANHKQSKKRTRQTIVRNARNRALRTRVRGFVKKVRTAIEDGNVQEASTAMPEAVKALDRAVTKGVLPRKTASRTISRLTVAVAKLSTPNG